MLEAQKRREKDIKEDREKKNVIEREIERGKYRTGDRENPNVEEKDIEQEKEKRTIDRKGDRKRER